MIKKTPYKTIYKKPMGKEARKKLRQMVAFWITFAFLVVILFIVNFPRISSTVENALWPAWFRSRAAQRNQEQPQVQQEPALYNESESPPLQNEEAPVRVAPSRQRPASQIVIEQGDPPAVAEQTAIDPPPAPPIQPVLSAPAEQAAVARPQPQPNPAPSPTLRERALYFVQLDRDGAVSQMRVSRSAPLTNSPLAEALEDLIKGPSYDERQRGIISLIPQDTRILSARISRDTAYINISEDFQYSTYGIEGYTAQLAQIVWTATEFSNIRDVQILIEGNRIDYLGEGIWIGSPINRGMFSN